MHLFLSNRVPTLHVQYICLTLKPKVTVYTIIREHIYTIIHPDKTIKRGERQREPEIE